MNVPNAVNVKGHTGVSLEKRSAALRASSSPVSMDEDDAAGTTARKGGKSLLWRRLDAIASPSRRLTYVEETLEVGHPQRMSLHHNQLAHGRTQLRQPTRPGKHGRGSHGSTPSRSVPPLLVVVVALSDQEEVSQDWPRWWSRSRGLAVIAHEKSGFQKQPLPDEIPAYN